MRAIQWLTAGVAVAAIAGCGGNRPDLTTETTSVRGHSIGYVQNSSGSILVMDRSENSQEGSLVTTRSNGLATSVDISFSGSMTDGTSIPKGGNLKVDPNNTTIFKSGDSFLTNVASSGNYLAVRYNTKNGSTNFVSYAVGGNKSGSMPTTGSATFNGTAGATVFGSDTGQAEVTGSSQLTATFAPGGGSIEGRLYNLSGPLQGTDILLNRRTLNGSNFQNGEVSLMNGGNYVPMTGSDYQGAFFGSGANEVAGTFHFGAQNVPKPGGGNQSVEGVGFFAASR